MRDFSYDLAALRQRVDEARVYLKVDQNRLRFLELEVDVAKPGLWDDPDRARQVSGQYAAVKADLAAYDGLAREMEDVETLHEMAREMDDESQEADIVAATASLDSQLHELELRALFTGSHDESDALVRINAKDGGVDAQDWAEILVRMYSRWAERRGFDLEIEYVSEGTEAGILSAEFTVKGRYAFGLMSAERGTHRLVRISPFDNNARRQTSFAAVDVYPMLEDVGDVEIPDSELKMEVFRASGAGGQHINKTSSAVRLIHTPSGLVASSQEERSQLQNRENALRRLKALLKVRQEEERAAELQRIAGGKQAQVGWGSQIRSYVLQPYQMVKDLRSEYEVGNVMAVLDGNDQLDELMESVLRWKRSSDVGIA
jgi:peptide chain release factor 2